MLHLKAFLIYSLWGAPVWAWFALGGLGTIEWALPKLPWPRARSLGELAANGLLTVLGRFPVLGPILRAIGTPQPVASPPPPPDSSLRALLPLAFVALALSGCATAGGKALKTCELSQLPAEEQALASSVANIALDVGSTVVDLEQLALAVGKAQFSCVAQAVAAWLAAPAPAIAPTPEVANALLQASADARRDHAKQVLGQYLASHPSACAARQAM